MEFKVLSVNGSGAVALDGSRRRHRPGVNPHLHGSGRRGEAPDSWREESHHPPLPRRSPTLPSCSASTTTVRSGEAPDHLERSCTTNCLARRQGDPRAVFTIKKAWMTTVHSYNERPELPGPADKDLRRARRRGVDHPDDHGRGDRRRRGDARAQGQVRRHRDARADAERLDRRSQRPRREEDHGEEVNAALKEAANGRLKRDPRGQRRSAGVDRLPRQLELVDRGQRLHERDGR